MELGDSRLAGGVEHLGHFSYLLVFLLETGASAKGQGENLSGGTAPKTSLWVGLPVHSAFIVTGLYHLLHSCQVFN